MKISFFTILLVIAGVYASPQRNIDTKNQRFITDPVRSTIDQISQQIKEAGLDPLEISSVYEYKPLPDLIEFDAFIDRLTFTGASNIAINKFDFDIFSSTVDYDLSLPELRLSVPDSGININVIGLKNTVRLNGSLSLKQFRLAGKLRFATGDNFSVSIQDVSVGFSLGSVESNFKLIALGQDHSEEVNSQITKTILDTLEEYKDEINKQLKEFLKEFLNVKDEYSSVVTLYKTDVL